MKQSNIVCGSFLPWILILSCNMAVGQEAESKPNHHENHYHLSAFAGFTTDYKDKNGYKLGIEYEYRITDHFGLAGTFDFTGSDFRIFAVSAGGVGYLFKFPLVLGAGIGAKSYEHDWGAFFRLMATYDFHLGDFSIGPMIMYDFFPNFKDIMSYGVTVGYSLH